MMLEVNAERYLVINNREIAHHGIFVGQELFQEINHSFEHLGYEIFEKKSEDVIKEDGVDVYVELRPYKEKTSYVTLMIKVKISFKNMINVVKEVKGMPKNCQQGDVLVVLDGWFFTEWEARWAMKPVVWFLKSIINKLIYIFPQEESYRNELVEDAAFITNRIKKLLRSYKEPEAALPPEEDIRMSIAEDIRKDEEKGFDDDAEYLDVKKSHGPVQP